MALSTFSSMFAAPVVSISSAAGWLAEAQKAREEEKGKKLLNVAITILDQAESVKNEKIRVLREYRKLEKKVRDEIKEMERAGVYFEETKNFGPLSKFLPFGVTRDACSSLGVFCPNEEDQKIPDDWTPKNELAPTVE